MGTSSAISRRKRNTSAAEKTNEFSSNFSPGWCQVLNSASNDWNPGLETMTSSAGDCWKDSVSREKQPSRRSGAVKLWNRIWDRNIHRVHIYTCTNVYTFIYMYIYTFTCTCIYMYTCTCTPIHVYMYKNCSTHTCTCTMYMYMYTVDLLDSSYYIDERYIYIIHLHVHVYTYTGIIQCTCVYYNDVTCTSVIYYTCD